VGAQQKNYKKYLEKFWGIKKMLYFCTRYPENNLFTLKKGLIPIEDMKRLPVRVIALFFS